MRKGIVVNKAGTKFEAYIFTTRRDAEAYAVTVPVLRRNASGSMLRHPAPVRKLANGSFAVI